MTIGTERDRAGAEAGTQAGWPGGAGRRWITWQDAGGLLALVTAVGLWVAVLAAVAGPLDATLARLDEARARAVEPPACPVPAGALAAAPPAPPGDPCR